MTKTRTTIDLSPEARAALKLPLEAYGDDITDAESYPFLVAVNTHVPYVARQEISTFIANLVNAALTPDSNTELAQQVTEQLETPAPDQIGPGVPMCAIPDCLDAAMPGYMYCVAHMHRWTIEETLQREG